MATRGSGDAAAGRCSEAAAKAQIIAAASSALRCGTLVSGVVCTLLAYGFLQERILHKHLRTDDYLSISVLLVLANRVTVMLFAMVSIGVQGAQFRNSVPLWKYAVISFATLGSSTCLLNASRFVSAPMYTFAKSFKMIPVMLWCFAITSLRYSGFDWCVAMMMTMGVGEFLTSGSSSTHATATGQAYMPDTPGLLIIAAFLVFEGFVPCFQEKLFREQATSKYNQMLYINGFSAIVSFISLVVSGKMSSSAHALFAEPPAVAQEAVFLCAVAVAGQWFVYSLIQEFGALMFAATMNIRQVSAVLFSYARLNRATTSTQTAGLSLFVMGSLWYSFLAAVPRKPGLAPTREHREDALEDVLCKAPLLDEATKMHKTYV